jgi:hypothetical protein
MHAAAIKFALKRGALVAAANWPVVTIQFIAESVFKALLMVPVIGAASLVTLLVGGSARELLASGIQGALTSAIDALAAHPDALGAYMLGLVVVMIGGSSLMFFVKGGTVWTLVEAESQTASLEAAPLSFAGVRQAARFTVAGFLAACDRYARRFLRLGIFLLVIYAVSGAVYLAALAWLLDDPRWTVGGSAVAALVSLGFGAWITVVNLLYLLTQVLVVTGNSSVRRAAAALPGLLIAERHLIGGLFLVMLALVVCATIASVLATGALGFIGFVPVVGLAVLPLQLLAWLARGFLFQFLGLAALGAYAGVARRAVAADAAGVPALPGVGTPREV